MNNSQRRLGLQAFALGLFGAGLGAREARAVEPDPVAISWVHGLSAGVGLPDLLESCQSFGHGRRVRGRSYSENCLQFAVPPVQGGSRVCAIWLRYQLCAGAAITKIRLFDGEREVAQMGDFARPTADWCEQRILCPHSVKVTRGLGVTVEMVFADVERELTIGAVGAEFSS